MGGKMKTTVQTLGKAIIEKGEYDLLVMTPNGNITYAKNEKAAQRILDKWQKKHTKKDSVVSMLVEWRHGLKPPG